MILGEVHFVVFYNYLVLTFPLSDTWNFLLEIVFSNSLNVVLQFIVLANFNNNPLFQIVMYADERSKKNAPDFSYRWKPFSMSIASARIGSQQFLFLLKPACSISRNASTSGCKYVSRSFSKSLYIVDSRDIGRQFVGFQNSYHLGFTPES